MIESFYNKKYCIWNLDLSKFQEKDNFDNELNKGFNNSLKEKRPPQANGFAYSTSIGDFINFPNLINFITPSLDFHFQLLTKRDEKKINRSWANRMHKDSFGSSHYHGDNVKVFILYYKVPEDSGELILIHPKYKIFDLLDPDSIPSYEKKHIKVEEGMCMLHDGSILHAVSKHNSDQVREAIIIEYKLVDKDG